MEERANGRTVVEPFAKALQIGKNLGGVGADYFSIKASAMAGLRRPSATSRLM